jgi:hypothetical protein
MKKRRSHHHNADVATELSEVSTQAYHELHGSYPKAAMAIAALGSVSAGLVADHGLTRSFFSGKRRRR